MSYRLIDSNAMQLRHPEVNDMPRIYVDLSNGLDGTHYDLRNGIAKRIEEVEAENAKLRELADVVKEFVEDSHCEDCPCRRDCNDNNRIFCADDFSYHAFAAMRKLRIEVGE